MLGKQSGQMGFGDLEATGRLPEGHFLKKIAGLHSPLENLLPTPYSTCGYLGLPATGGIWSGITTGILMSRRPGPSASASTTRTEVIFTAGK